MSIRGFKMNLPKITVDDIRAMKVRGEKIAALTAYDFPLTKLLDEAGIRYREVEMPPDLRKGSFY